MWKEKLCLSTNDEFGVPVPEQIRLFHQAGFDGFFTEWSPESDIAGYKRLSDELGMDYQSIHAPFGRAADMWKGGREAEMAVDELLACLSDCAQNAVPIMVVHAFIGFGDHGAPTAEGVESYRKIAETASKLGVKIAIENTEGEEYLRMLMEQLKEYDCVGFCLDTGHEMCYNHSQDLLALYGDRIICTHLNDNLGVRDYSGEITWRDDLHLLPFDGIADWEDIIGRLLRHHYNGYLTFELNKKSKAGRHDNDIYDNMSLEQYLAEAYKRACRVAAIKLRAEGGLRKGAAGPF